MLCVLWLVLLHWICCFVVNMPGSIPRESLLNIRRLMQESGPDSSKLSPECWTNLRKHGINRIPATVRGKRARRNKQQPVPVQLSIQDERVKHQGQFGSNQNNLVVMCPQCPSHSDLKACLINCQSLCSKVQAIKDYVVDNNLDMVLMTETWLGSDKHKICGDLTPKGYGFLHVPRKTGRGGGVGFFAQIYSSCH